MYSLVYSYKNILQVDFIRTDFSFILQTKFVKDSYMTGVSGDNFWAHFTRFLVTLSLQVSEKVEQ